MLLHRFWSNLCLSVRADLELLKIVCLAHAYCEIDKVHGAAHLVLLSWGCGLAAGL
jgi:hypothetical protein